MSKAKPARRAGEPDREFEQTARRSPDNLHPFSRLATVTVRPPPWVKTVHVRSELTTSPTAIGCVDTTIGIEPTTSASDPLVALRVEPTTLAPTRGVAVIVATVTIRSCRRRFSVSRSPPKAPAIRRSSARRRPSPPDLPTASAPIGGVDTTIGTFPDASRRGRPRDAGLSVRCGGGSAWLSSASFMRTPLRWSTTATTPETVVRDVVATSLLSHDPTMLPGLKDDALHDGRGDIVDCRPSAAMKQTTRPRPPRGGPRSATNRGSSTRRNVTPNQSLLPGCGVRRDVAHRRCRQAASPGNPSGTSRVRELACLRDLHDGQLHHRSG